MNKTINELLIHINESIVREETKALDTAFGSKAKEAILSAVFLELRRLNEAKILVLLREDDK